MNENYSVTDILELSKQTALNISGISEQMGIITTTVQRHDVEIRQNKEDVKTIREDFEQYKESQADSMYIRPEQAQELVVAAKSRVAELLKPYGDSVLHKYYGKFMSRFWNDAKNARMLIGSKGVYTPQRSYEPAKNYINAWTPYKYGVPGYIEHLKRLNDE